MFRFTRTEKKNIFSLRMINYRSLNKLYSVTVLAGKLIFDLGKVGENTKSVPPL